MDQRRVDSERQRALAASRIGDVGDEKFAQALAQPVSAAQKKIDSERQKALASFNPGADPGVMKAAARDMAPAPIDLRDGPVQMSAAGIKRLADLEVERVAKRTKPAAKPTVAKRQKSAKAGAAKRK